MIDIHSHILYGIDDGSPSLQESKRMLSAAQEAGISRIVATPHVRKASFDRTIATARWQELRDIAAQKKIRLDLGFEVHWGVLVQMEQQALEAYCFQGSRKMLIEFSLSADDLPDGHDRMIYSMQRSGIEIIIAHPERYRFVHRDLSLAERWKDMGCCLQLDAICLRQSYEPGSKRTAKKLYQNGLYDYYASDAHCSQDYVLFAQSLNWIERHG